MDLSLHGSLLWRYRYIVLPGLALAVVLALLSIARPVMGSRPTLVYRDAELWGSTSTLLLTRPGFPEGRLTPTTDPFRLATIAQTYAELARSDEVSRLLRRQGPFEGSVSGRAFGGQPGAPAPLLSISVQAATAEKALALTHRATSTFVAYVKARQRAAGTARSDRIKLQVVQAASGAAVVKPRKYTLPIVVFLATISLAVGLVYVLETMRRRREAARFVKPVTQEPPRHEPQPVGEVKPVTEEPPRHEPEPVGEARSEPVGEALTSRRWA